MKTNRFEIRYTVGQKREREITDSEYLDTEFDIRNSRVSEIRGPSTRDNNEFDLAFVADHDTIHKFDINWQREIIMYLYQLYITCFQKRQHATIINYHHSEFSQFFFN